jgi:hypothetical protein
LKGLLFVAIGEVFHERFKPFFSMNECQIFDPKERQEHSKEKNIELNNGFLKCVYRRK